MTRRVERPGRGQRGSVTTELALALPAVLALAGVLLGIGSIATAKVQCVSAAHAAARQAIVTPEGGAVAKAAHRVAGGRVSVTSSTQGQWITVTVSRTVTAGWFDVRVTGRAQAKAEPTWPG